MAELFARMDGLIKEEMGGRCTLIKRLDSDFLTNSRRFFCYFCGGGRVFIRLRSYQLRWCDRLFAGHLNEGHDG